MSQAEWAKNWKRINKHRKATTRDAKNGDAKRWSREVGSEAQYSPVNFGDDNAVRELELRCIEQGIMIRSTQNKRTYYLYAGFPVGWCCGTITSYVHAEWHQSGGVIHGRPICEKCLKMKPGVQL